MVLGATGFIGKNLALYFSRNLKIKATYNIKIPLKTRILNGLNVILQNLNNLKIFLTILIL